MKRPIVTRPNIAAADVDAFVSEVDSHPLFDASREIVVARAPGRLDLMGGIADYSGALVLQWPLREAAIAAVQRTTDATFRVVSLASSAGESQDRVFETAAGDLFPNGNALAYDAARAWFAARGDSKWAAYVLGALIVLAREKGVCAATGLRILIRSHVPEGKGVSSSAAVEVASMQAIAEVLGVALEPRECALLSQKVENRIVGAACGVMDQMTAVCGNEGQLMALLCQPCELRPSIALPAELAIFGLDSGVRHSVSGSDYTSVRVGAFMGARILGVDDAHWAGYLANVTPTAFEAAPQWPLPVHMSGADFLSKFGSTRDAVTHVRGDRDYAVRAPTAHPVYEHFRVCAFAELLRAPITLQSCVRLGELMYDSHASYSSCGLGSSATDAIVTVARDLGAGDGFFGAKITGGGSGGTVAVLARRDAPIGALVEACAKRLGHRPRVFSGSSPGAAVFGVMRLGAAPA